MSGYTREKFAEMIGISRRTLIRYIVGSQLPGTLHLHLMSRTLKVRPQKLYAEYYVHFAKRNGRRTGQWFNEMPKELVMRGWTAHQLSHECMISLRCAYMIVAFNYPPTEKMLKRLERGLSESRDEFWKDWEHQQRRHLYDLRMR